MKDKLQIFPVIELYIHIPFVPAGKWDLIENEYLGKIIYIFATFGILGMLFCAFTHFCQYPFYPTVKKNLKKLSLQDLLFENLKK
jgi:hypothetical protein